MAELFDETFRMSKDEIVSGLASLGVFLTDLAAGSSSMTDAKSLYYAAVVAAAIHAIKPEIALEAAKEVENDE